MPATKDTSNLDDGVVEEKRRELSEQIQKFKTKEAEVAEQIQSRKETSATQRANVKNVIDNLKAMLDRREQELMDALQRQEEEEAAELERTHDALSSHAATVEQVLEAGSDHLVLQMMKELEPRVKEVESRCQRAHNLEPVGDLDDQAIDDLTSALSALGEPKADVPEAAGVSSSNSKSKSKKSKRKRKPRW